jgi:hypothetical protein
MTDTNDAGGRRLAVFALGESQRPDGKTSWTKIGHAFDNRDGSITLRLNAFPIGTDKLQVRELRDEERAAPALRRNPGVRVEEVRP